MPSIIRATALLALALLQSVQAHTYITKMLQNGNDLGATCLRRHSGGASSPIKNLQGQEMACGYGGDKPAKSTCPVKPGDKIGLYYGDEEHHLTNTHTGPASVMMKKVDDAATAQGPGDGWFRVFFHGHENGQWGTETMMEDGIIDFVIPEGLPGGNYFIRGELVAMHGRYRPEFFVSCLQVDLASSGTGSPQTVSIPGNYVDKSTPAMQWDNDVTEGFPYYGPPVFGSGESPTSSGNTVSGSSTVTESPASGSKNMSSEEGSEYGSDASTTTVTDSSSTANEESTSSEHGSHGSSTTSDSTSSSSSDNDSSSSPSRTTSTSGRGSGRGKNRDSKKKSKSDSGRGRSSRGRGRGRDRDDEEESAEDNKHKSGKKHHCDEEEKSANGTTTSTASAGPTAPATGRYARRAVLY